MDKIKSDIAQFVAAILTALLALGAIWLIAGTTDTDLNTWLSQKISEIRVWELLLIIILARVLTK
jgi:hypothetical protein